MRLEKKSEGYVQVGPFIDVDNNFLDSLTLTIYLSKNGSPFAARDSDVAIVHDARGFYRVYLNKKDRDTLGTLQLQAVDFSTPDELALWQTYEIVPSIRR